MRDRVVTIQKDGKLGCNTTTYDDRLDRATTISVDATDNVAELLFRECAIDSDVTLKDVFMLIENNLPLFTSILPYHVEELIIESKEVPPEETENPSDTVLEVYWLNDHDSYDDINEFTSHVGFHMVSRKDELPVGLDFLPVNMFIDLPIRHNLEFKIYGRLGYPSDLAKINDHTFDFGVKYFTLIETIRAIFYELSFYGPPSRRNENIKIIKDRIEGVDLEAGSISLDELLEKYDYKTGGEDE